MAQLITKPILSIAIPTYERAKFLDRCLNFLYNQVKNQNYPIEIIVSDNASKDNTTEIVKNYIDKGLEIRYIRNSKNMGADFNVAQCYFNCNGKYIMAFGDDDVFLEGSIRLLVNLLERNDYGVVFLRNIGYDSNHIPVLNNLDIKIYHNNLKYLQDVNIYITFISGNIINAKYFSKAEAYINVGSNVNHVAFIFKAIMLANENVIIENPVIATEPDNTGGYNLFDTFGKELSGVIDKLKGIEPNKIKSGKKVINNGFLTLFFPVHILNFIKKNNNKFINLNPKKEMIDVFKNYPLFWIFCYPLFFIPESIGRLYYRIMRKLLSTFFKITNY